MFQVGELVIYETTGVCRVEAVGTAPEIPVAAPGRWYYQMAPLYSNGTIYAPVEGKVFIRPVISKEEALDLIARIPEIRDDIFQDCEQRQLESRYRQTLRARRCEGLAEMVKTLRTKDRRLSKAGKRLGRVDQEYRKRAEELLHGELAAALDIPYDQVRDYVVRRAARKSLA